MRVILVEITSMEVVRVNIVVLVSINHFISCFMGIEVIFIDLKAIGIITDFEVTVMVKNLLSKD